MEPHLLAEFDAHRPLLFAIAYRMLGRVTDAEDILQEAYLRWHQAGQNEVQSPKAFLSAIVTRLCIDHLRSAHVRRETYPGFWLPEPLMTERSSAAGESIELAESLSMAFLVLLESLSPVERAVFLLREVFDYDYADIAEFIGKTEANCRQMVKRARERIATRRPRFEPTPEQHDRLTRQFLSTCFNGDLEGLKDLLARDVTLWSDGGGKVVAAMHPVKGASKVARFLAGIFRKAPAGSEVRPAVLNGQPGFLGYVEGQLRVAALLDVVDGRVHGIYFVNNPDKLTRLPQQAQQHAAEN